MMKREVNRKMVAVTVGSIMTVLSVGMISMAMDTDEKAAIEENYPICASAGNEIEGTEKAKSTAEKEEQTERQTEEQTEQWNEEILLDLMSGDSASDEDQSEELTAEEMAELEPDGEMNREEILEDEAILDEVGETEDAMLSVGGECGMGVTWSFERASGMLTISGTGAMEDFKANDIQPWYDYAEEITQICVEEGVREIGEFAFEGISYAETIQLPSTLAVIGDGALRDMDQLEKIYVNEANEDFAVIDDVLFNADYTLLICYPQQKKDSEYRVPKQTEEIAKYAFYGQDYLETILFPTCVTQIGDDAFAQCMALGQLEMYEE